MCLSSLKRQNIKSMRSHGVKESTETKFCFVLIKHVVHGVIINRRCTLTESRSQITLSIWHVFFSFLEKIGSLMSKNQIRSKMGLECERALTMSLHSKEWSISFQRKNIQQNVEKSRNKYSCGAESSWRQNVIKRSYAKNMMPSVLGRQEKQSRKFINCWVKFGWSKRAKRSVKFYLWNTKNGESKKILSP